MEAPTDFVERLKSVNPLLRIRYSYKRDCWQIEQQVGRGALPPIHIDPYDDNLIRAKDGYWLVCEVRLGTRMPCPDCGLELKVPSLQFKEVKCEYCILNRRDGRHMAGYFPLGEALLDHLRFLNPLTGGIERNAAMIDAFNDKLLKTKERDLSNLTETMKDDYAYIAGIPSVGYTGNNKTIHWSKF